MKRYYELLDVDPAASGEQIKHAFRREIARYHPDKVQHLGREFQELAAARAAELTEAYGALMNPARRAAYDATGQARTAAVAPAAPPPAASPADPRRTGEPQAPPGSPAAAPSPRPGAGLNDEFLKKAAIARFRKAVEAEVGGVEEQMARGFDVAFLARPRRGLFKKGMLKLVGRFVGCVDGGAVEETWPFASRLAAESEVPCCVFLMGPGLAPARELADAIAGLRRRQRAGSPLVLVPVDLRNWQALMPADAPASARAIAERLRDV